MNEPSVTRRFSQALVETAARLGLAELPPVPDGERVALEVQDRLWERMCATSPDPLLGIQLALNLQVGHLDVAGLLLMSCETVGESVEAFTEYLPIIGEGGDAELQVDAEPAWLAYHARYEVCRAQRVEMVLACAIHLARWSTAGHFQPEAVQFTHQALDEEARYAGLLGCPVEFAAELDRVLFPRRMLDQPLIQANPTLRNQLRELADESLKQLGNRSLSASVSELVREHPQAGKDRIAELLAMSGRHLNRKLAEEGFSFKQLRDRELQALACQALGQGDKITAISAALGFSDESAFSRTFRRWTGVAPSQYRG